ncbi:uncharacterized protein LOC113594727 [Acinonyx jubatus]|uniref:Uncharacterized protein LOC113594727 n=1 Tax=Acinonyx jubatus TaxID=32536 RepID=A0ABM3NXP3_ACIJB|nr:uncharacterized protein LOC113594727 [Acinonyx jubatus]
MAVRKQGQFLDMCWAEASGYSPPGGILHMVHGGCLNGNTSSVFGVNLRSHTGLQFPPRPEAAVSPPQDPGQKADLGVLGFRSGPPEGYKGGGASAASAIRGYSCAGRLRGAVWAGAGASESSRLQNRPRLLLIERAPCVKTVIIRDVFAGWLADLTEQHQEELATMKALDAGTAFTLALKTHVGTSIQTFRYFAGWCDKIQVTPLTALKFTDLTLKADMAKGVVNILLGSEQKEDVYKGFYKCTHGPPSASLSCDVLTTLFLAFQ